MLCQDRHVLPIQTHSAPQPLGELQRAVYVNHCEIAQGETFQGLESHSYRCLLRGYCRQWCFLWGSDSFCIQLFNAVLINVFHIAAIQS